MTKRKKTVRERYHTLVEAASGRIPFAGVQL